MKKLLLSLLILSRAAFSAENAPLTPENLKAQIRQQGIANIIKSMPDTPGGEWSTIIGNISSGDAKWLSVVPLLAPGVDAGFSEDLGAALAAAIPKNPDGVMGVIDDRQISVSTQSVCSMPLYSETVQEQNQYVVNAIQALYRSKTAQAQKCLNVLIQTVGQSGPFTEEN